MSARCCFNGNRLRNRPRKNVQDSCYFAVYTRARARKHIHTRSTHPLIRRVAFAVRPAHRNAVHRDFSDLQSEGKHCVLRKNCTSVIYRHLATAFIHPYIKGDRARSKEIIRQIIERIIGEYLTSAHRYKHNKLANIKVLAYGIIGPRNYRALLTSHTNY